MRVELAGCAVAAKTCAKRHSASPHARVQVAKPCCTWGVILKSLLSASTTISVHFLLYLISARMFRVSGALVKYAIKCKWTVLRALLTLHSPSLSLCSYAHIHTSMEASKGNVGFSVWPKDASTSDPGKPESNHQPSNWWATAAPPELQPKRVFKPFDILILQPNVTNSVNIH